MTKLCDVPWETLMVGDRVNDGGDRYGIIRELREFSGLLEISIELFNKNGTTYAKHTALHENWLWKYEERKVSVTGANLNMNWPKETEISFVENNEVYCKVKTNSKTKEFIYDGLCMPHTDTFQMMAYINHVNGLIAEGDLNQVEEHDLITHLLDTVCGFHKPEQALQFIHNKFFGDDPQDIKG